MNTHDENAQPDVQPGWLLSRLDLATLHLAVACAELGSMSAAARRVHCTVSAASHRVSALEAAIGKQLFVRDWRGLRPTCVGRMFVAHGRSLLEEIERLHRSVRSAEESGVASRRGGL